MKRFLKGLLACVGVILLVSLLVGVWWLFIDGRAPAKRPDLVRLPESLPEPPGGYLTEKAMALAFTLGRLELDDIEHVEVPPDVVEKLDVEYGRGGTKPLLLDLYTPRTLAGPAPGLIFIHGGGWRSGKRSDYKFYTTHFAQQGFVVATVSYRFSQEAPFPAAVEDVKCAVRWMRANAAELNVDPERICAIGGSAGGYLAMMLGFTADVKELEGAGGHEGVSSAVAAVVDLYGPTDLTTPFASTHTLVESFLAKKYADDPALFTYASPITHVDAQDPPTFILQGTIDSLVTVDQSDMLAEKLKGLGVPYWYARLDGWPHTMDLAVSVNAYTKEAFAAFFKEYLKEQPGTAAAR